MRLFRCINENRRSHDLKPFSMVRSNIESMYIEINKYPESVNMYIYERRVAIC